MNFDRVRAIAGRELRTQLANPLFGALLLLLLFLASALNPVAMIPGSAGASGELAPRPDSVHALAQAFAIGSFFGYTFFAALLAGLAVVRDDECGVTRLLFATPLTRVEYLFGKLGGVLAALALALAFHVGLVAARNEIAASDGRIPVADYLVAALVVAGPGIFFVAVVAFVAGERRRRPMAAAAVPIAIFALTILVSWNFHPAGLDPRLDRLLIVLDPTAIRWLDRVVFAVDRGFAHFDRAPLPFDTLFVANRCWTIGGPLLLLIATLRRRAPRTRISPRDATRRSPVERVASGARFASLESLGMSSRPPGSTRAALAIARAELRELGGRPGVHLFVAALALVLADVAGSTADLFGEPAALAAGEFAVRALPVLTILVCCYLLFATVESLHRDLATGFEPLQHGSPVSDAAIVLGKSVAHAAVAGWIVAASAGVGAAIVAFTPGAKFEIAPFALVFGAVLAPTLLAWTAFLAATHAATRSRPATLAAGLLALVATGALFLSGEMTWVSNWPVWGALRWTDFGVFPLHGATLLWNRALALGSALFLLAVAHRLHRRRERDAMSRPTAASVGRRLARLLPFAAAPLFAALFLAVQIRDGFQGDVARASAGERWRQNAATWRSTELPEIEDLELAIDLFPEAGRVAVAGELRLRNAGRDPIRWLPWSVSDDWGTVAWRIGERSVEAHRRAGVETLELEPPLAPGADVAVGFRYSASVPRGFSRNGGAVDDFVVADAVLLSSMRGTLLPELGVTQTADPRGGMVPASYPDGTAPEPPGRPTRSFPTRVVVTAPESFEVLAVGHRLEASTRGGRRRAVFESRVPASALAVAAARWETLARGASSVLHLPRHEARAPEILRALEAARDRYSAWFGSLPWRDLRVAEIPDLTGEATSFPSLVVVSERLGFLGRGSVGSGLAFSVTAHEVAHQWWGHRVAVAEGPGTGLLVEGMANYATLRLHESERGAGSRRAFARQLERLYLERRRASGERAVLFADDATAAGEATSSLKGAWVLWMLERELGEARMLGALRELVAAPRAGDRELVPADFVAAFRAAAPDRERFDRFADAWLTGTGLPEFRVRDAGLVRFSDGWRATATLDNVGALDVDVELGLRFAGEGPSEAVASSRIRLPAGASVPVVLESRARPSALVVDPGVELLQVGRERAVAELAESRPL